jgi:hypothetical protein
VISSDLYIEENTLLRSLGVGKKRSWCASWKLAMVYIRDKCRLAGGKNSGWIL